MRLGSLPAVTEISYDDSTETATLEIPLTSQEACSSLLTVASALMQERIIAESKAISTLANNTLKQMDYSRLRRDLGEFTQACRVCNFTPNLEEAPAALIELGKKTFPGPSMAELTAMQTAAEAAVAQQARIF